MNAARMGFRIQAQIVLVLMRDHGYGQDAAIDAVDTEAQEIWVKLPAGHETSVGRICASVVELRRVRSELPRARRRHR